MYRRSRNSFLICGQHGVLVGDSHIATLGSAPRTSPRCWLGSRALPCPTLTIVQHGSLFTSFKSYSIVFPDPAVISPLGSTITTRELSSSTLPNGNGLSHNGHRGVVDGALLSSPARSLVSSFTDRCFWEVRATLGVLHHRKGFLGFLPVPNL